MTGFLKRDYYLISGNLKFYALFMAAFAILVVFTDAKSAFLSFYVVLFAMSSVMGLFSYDDFNRWTAYGASAPQGRKAMVNARYLLTVLLGAGVGAIQLLLGLLGKEEGTALLAAMYSGVFLLYASVTLPVSYHFGGTKARTVMIVIVAVMAGLIGIGGTVMNLSSVGGLRLPFITLLFPLLGLAALALSYRISLLIMTKKEL